MLKIVEKYWEAESGSVCLIYCNINHDHPESYGQKPAKCTLYIRLYKLKEHKCKISSYKVGSEKICIYI